MPKMHAISLLASGALIGTIVGYAIARYAPRLSPASTGHDDAPKGGPAWSDKMRSMFKRHAMVRKSPYSASGNQAFETYREATLRRLQDEQREFEAYLDRLRRAKDKEAFDAYLANRSSAQSRQE